MQQIKNESLLPGKTIKRTDAGENAFFIFFTDDTFCIFRGCGYSGDNEVELCDDHFHTEPTISSGWEIKELLRLGFITEQEANAAIQKYEEQCRISAENDEINQLQRLKEKYPNI